MNVEQFSSRIIDLAAEKDFIQDFSIDMKEGVVVDSRIKLEDGFVDVFRNFDTGRVAFAYIVDEERVFGADNTGGWHTHPIENPGDHVESDEISLEQFFRMLENKFDLV
ncbi:hypothetical protein [Candidatus Nanohalobium constans]|uniref:Uncharacterized protein n=1 Tax=Candidatus Nanohalobium constans TaxID=2565781 RepID=A0A5Q0UHW0_9ARCH|nr:hypothetical protein [Candidatus Nanohalobium constans]QGA80931.1 hypothetical protein LC1Nh_1059 [Candidatus Nanohalobium constans]